MDLETRILVSITRKYSGIVPFWKMEIFMKCVLETGKITEEVLETGKIPKSGNILEHLLVTRKFLNTFQMLENFRNTSQKQEKFPEYVPETGKYLKLF